MIKSKNVDKYIISNAETFNKYLLALSSAAFPALWYLIAKKEGWLLGLKVSLAFFAVAVILNMLSLILIIDDPVPKKCKDIFYIILQCNCFILLFLGFLLKRSAQVGSSFCNM